MANNKVYQIVTDQIIAKMQEGRIPWIKPWKTDARSTDGMLSMFPCYSYSKNKRYELINQMLLDFIPGEYATFEQIKKAGGRVVKGAKSKKIVGWIVDRKVSPVLDADGNPVLDDDDNPVVKERKVFSLRYYQVFNICDEQQVTGMKPRHDWTESTPDSDPIEPVDDAGLELVENAEQIIAGYINSSNAPVLEIVKGSDKAYFSPSQDRVVVPHISQFNAVAEYYSTVFHELTHSTGIASRCGRKELEKMVAFGDENYSKEELVAEIGSCFLNSHAGLTTESSFRNSTAYLQGWLNAISGNPEMIVFASSQAEKAVEYILNAK